MKVKVQCPCGTRFEFDVEPLNGRMPVGINCPGCNEGATELANAVIRQQSAPPAVGIAAAPVMPPSPPPPAPAPPPSSSLRISKSPSAHAAPAAAAPAPVTPGDADAPTDSSAQLCPKHKKEPAVDSCVVCGKPLCLLCMEQFGHVCSVYCRQQAEHKRIYIPAYAHQKSVLAEKSNRRAKLITAAVVFLVLAVFGLWFYYAWFARNPKVVYSLVLADKNETLEQRLLRPPEFYKLIAPNELLSVKNKQASLLDITKNKPLWTTPLKSDADTAVAKPASGKNSDPDEFASEEDYNFSSPLVNVTTNDLWLATGDRLLRLDRKTGALKDSPIHGKVLAFFHGESSLLAVFIDPNGQRTLAKVNLSDATIQTAALTGPPGNVKPSVKALAAKHLLVTNTPPPGGIDIKSQKKLQQVQAFGNAAGRAMQSSALEPDAGTITSGQAPSEYINEAMSFAFNGGEVPPFTVSGPGVVQFKARLLEEKSITRQAMKPKGKSILEGNVTASQGLDLAQEMMNDSQRDMTGGVETEDVSRYQVTLHRWFVDNVPDWTGEVVGPPRFYSLKTIDLLVAGQSLTVFDRNNKKLWDGKLSYPMQFIGDHPPFLETADSLYFADPGVLTCFDLATGNVRWRLNSVGISRILADLKGKIYITTTTADVDNIKFSQQHNIHSKIHPVIEKVDPATGKVLWREESLGSECQVSGKFLYCTYVTQTQAALKLEEGPDTHFNLNLLNPGNGSVIWNYHVNNHFIRETDVQQNWIMLRFEHKLVVLKFFSL